MTSVSSLAIKRLSILTAHINPLRLLSMRCVSSLEERRRTQKRPVKRRKIMQSQLRELDEGESQILYSTDDDLQELEFQESSTDESHDDDTIDPQYTAPVPKSKEMSIESIDKLLPEIRRHIKPIGEYLYGPNAVLSALKANKRPFFHRLFLSPISNHSDDKQSDQNAKSKRARNFEEITSLCDTMEIPIEYCSKQELNHFVSKNMHQGVVLDCDPLSIPKLDEHPLEEQVGSIWIAFDHLFNEENVGAVLRSSLFFGIDGCIFASKHRAPLSPLVATASSGALDGIDIRLCAHQPLDEYLGSMKDNGWNVVGLDVKGNEENVEGPNIMQLTAFDRKSDMKMIVVIGNESRGLSSSVRGQCTELIYIGGNEQALQYNVDSLNVASACSCALYQIMHRHRM